MRNKHRLRMPSKQRDLVAVPAHTPVVQAGVPPIGQTRVESHWRRVSNGMDIIINVRSLTISTDRVAEAVAQLLIVFCLRNGLGVRDMLVRASAKLNDQGTEFRPL